MLLQVTILFLLDPNILNISKHLSDYNEFFYPVTGADLGVFKGECGVGGTIFKKG